MKKLPLIAFACLCVSAEPPLRAAPSDSISMATREIESLPKNVQGPTAKSFAEATQATRAWREQTSLDYYAKHGLRDARWDADAKVVLKEFSARGTLTDSKATADAEARLDRTIRSVKKAGCGDPLLNYIFVRVARANDGLNWKAYADEMQPVTDALMASQAPCHWKLWACLRTADAMESAAPDKRKLPAKAYQFRDSAVVELFHILKDPALPAEEFYQSADGVAKFFKPYKGPFGDTFLALESVVLARWSNDARAHLTMGDFYVDHAWNARGGSYAEKVTDQGRKDFEQRLRVAARHLERAWKLDPSDARIAKRMMSVELGQGEGRDRMEVWFQRAMKLSPDDTSTAHSKLYYLEPKWHGSPEEMLAFGRECVTNAAWGGDVALTLVDAHRRLAGYVEQKEQQAEYWKQPTVWRDLKLAYDRHFKDQPTADRQAFIRYAYRCEQWDVLHRELKFLAKPNHAFFGGKDEFDKMARLAAERANTK